MGAMEFLSNWILHFDRFDLLVKRGKRVAPKNLDERRKLDIGIDHRPFFWRYDFDDPRLHSIFIDFRDEGLEAAKLVHCLCERY